MMKRNYIVLILLALLFAAPGVTAYFYYQNPAWLSKATTNKGQLLRPPLLFAKEFDNKQKWRLMFWYPGDCDKTCLQVLDKLARTRLALGRRLYEVDECLLQHEGSSQLKNLRPYLQEQAIKVLAISQKTFEAFPFFGKTPKIVIANPEGYLVMSFKKEALPKDIYHDLKQLLNTTEKKSG